ncbi:cilia- and flagella-associated protein 337-like [Convolutriloba macropyga]|uniref:cilia- and flagella-associated protein 337-like n=1 Tax=Convolutriloba macropyga TaxID=536237 RepID=UPI003F51B29A
MSKTSSVLSAKSIITDLDTVGVSGKKIEDTMKLSHVMDLVRLFQEHVPTTEIDPLTYQEGDLIQQPGMMLVEEFQSCAKRAMGIDTSDFDQEFEELFHKVDSKNTGYVVLMDFVMYMLQKYWERDSMEAQLKSPFQSKPRIRLCRHNHQEPTVKVVLIRNPSRYISFSKEGEFGIWDQHELSLGRVYRVDTEQQDNNNKKMVHKVWVMDAVVLQDCGKMAVSTTGRDIRFYDISSAVIFEEFQLYGLSHVVTCFDYYCSTNFRIQTDSILTTGDDGGHIYQYMFLQARNKLFEKPPRQAKGQKTRVYINEIKAHSKCVRVEELLNRDEEKFHHESVRAVRYFTDNHVILSTSGSSQSSVVMADKTKTRAPYIWKIDKGVECFDLSRKLDLLVTGSVDHFVKFWNQYVTTRPLTVLKGHNATIVGVAIIENLGFVVSYSEDAIIKVWHLIDYKCVDTIDLNFQCLENRAPEHGNFPISFFPSLNCYLFTCNDYMAELKVGTFHQFLMDYVVTHASPLCGAIYNHVNGQIVTACDDSEVAVWNSETGAVVTRLYKAHDNEEITAMSFDQKGERLITGGRDGTGKVWYYQSGVLSHVLLPTDDAEVTSILPVQHMGKPVIVTGGWNRKIVVYADDAETERVQVAGRQKWKGGQLHKDDILSMDICYPWMASGSFDGELILWHSEQETVEGRLLKGGYDTTENRDQILEAGMRAANIDCSRPDTRQSRPSTHASSRSSRSRPSSRHRKSWAQTPIAGRLPIDKVMFLKSRATSLSTQKALLVSSEAGSLSFWHCFSKQLFASFYAASRPHHSVLAMFEVGSKNQLITGDTRGYISIWNIEEYAVKPAGEVVTTAPPLLKKFKAHYHAIVSVEWFKHSSGTSFILSASSDRAARLWSYGGSRLVGTFGQSHKWDLRDVATWNQEGLDLSNSSGFSKSTTFVSEQSQDTLGQSQTDGGGSGSAGTHPGQDGKDAIELPDDEDGMLEHVAEYLKEMSESTHVGKEPSLLGTSVERTFLTRIKARKSRREQFEVNMEKTNRFEDICAPFQALQPKPLASEELPKNLPLPSRAVTRTSAANIPVEDIMPLRSSTKVSFKIAQK